MQDLETTARTVVIEGPDGERRDIQDRRRRPTPAVSRYTFWGGRRREARRPEDAEVHRFVDIYDNRFLVPLLMLLTLSLTDALFTLYFIKHGAREVNPIMDYFLQMSGVTFYYVKFGATAAGITVLCWLKNFGRVKQILYLLTILYAVVDLNHLILWGTMRL